MNVKVDTQENNPLIESYMNDDLDKFRQLIMDGANVNCLSNQGVSLMELVIRNEENSLNKKFFDILIENNVSLYPIGVSPNLLFIALYYDRKFFFKKLLDLGINFEMRNNKLISHQDHIIFEIIRMGEYYFMDLILNEKLRIGITNHKGDTVLTNFIKSSDIHFTKKQSVDIFRRLIDLGEDVNDRGNYGRVPLHYVVSYRAHHFLDLLLEDGSGIELNNRDMEGYTALTYAVINENFIAIKKLIDKGVNLNILNGKNESALFFSIVHDKKRIFNYLVSKNAAVNDIDKDGNNILHKMISNEWNHGIMDMKYYEKIINKHPELIFTKNKKGESPIDLLTINNSDHYIKKNIYKIIEKLDKSKLIEPGSMSL